MTIYVFDMDGTLTPARKPMTEEFAEIIQGQDRIILYETELTKFAAV